MALPAFFGESRENTLKSDIVHKKCRSAHKIYTAEVDKKVFPKGWAGASIREIRENPEIPLRKHAWSHCRYIHTVPN